MKQPLTHTLTAPLDASLRALQDAVAARFNWRIITRGEREQPRFVVEKQVRHDLIRGWTLHAIYQINGGFREAGGISTELYYTVSNQDSVPLIQAGFHVLVLVVMTLFLNRLVTSPPLAGNWIGGLLVAALVGVTTAYIWFAYRRHQAHLRELSDFMARFARRMEANR